MPALGRSRLNNRQSSACTHLSHRVLPSSHPTKHPSCPPTLHLHIRSSSPLLPSYLLSSFLCAIFITGVQRHWPSASLPDIRIHPAVHWELGGGCCTWVSRRPQQSDLICSAWFWNSNRHKNHYTHHSKTISEELVSGLRILAPPVRLIK